MDDQGLMHGMDANGNIVPLKLTPTGALTWA